MIEILNGTHETVAYRDMKGIKAFMNTDPEDFPLHWLYGTDQRGNHPLFSGRYYTHSSGRASLPSRP